MREDYSLPFKEPIRLPDDDYKLSNLVASLSDEAKLTAGYYGLEPSLILYSPQQPVAHFGSGEVLTSKLVTDLQNDPSAKLLSVGAGHALAERLLIEKLGVRPNQVTVADISHYPSWPSYLNTVTFDATDLGHGWSILAQGSFRYIIFPLSLHDMVRSAWKTEEQAEKAYRLVISILMNAVTYLESRGELRATTDASLVDPTFEKFLRDAFSSDFDLYVGGGLISLRKH